MTKKQCPLGEDCDLTTAWMLGRQSAKAEAAARIEELEAKLARAVEALEGVLGACDEGRMIPRPGHGAGGMTIEANIKGSIYTGVPAWPIEEARTTLAELKGDKT
jgi:hypothetical protein